jgi:hypothetical protein
VQGLAATNLQGIEIGDALMGVGWTVRFEMIARITAEPPRRSL